MFALFFNLYYALFIGTWNQFSINDISNLTKGTINKVGEFFTTIFGDNQLVDLGDTLIGFTGSYSNMLTLVSLILATITSIGIVVLAVKGIKKAFGIFFMGVNRL